MLRTRETKVLPHRKKMKGKIAQKVTTSYLHKRNLNYVLNIKIIRTCSLYAADDPPPGGGNGNTMSVFFGKNCVTPSTCQDRVALLCNEISNHVRFMVILFGESCVTSSCSQTSISFLFEQIP